MLALLSIRKGNVLTAARVRIHSLPAFWLLAAIVVMSANAASNHPVGVPVAFRRVGFHLNEGQYLAKIDGNSILVKRTSAEVFVPGIRAQNMSAAREKTEWCLHF